MGKNIGWITALWMGASASMAVLAQGAWAENLFSPVIKVNDEVITGFELDQRIRFMQLLNQPGDIPFEAKKSLIEDRLRISLARRFDVKLPPEVIQTGMEEFAGRANLSAADFIKAIGEAGIEPESFRDFIEAGMMWRDIIRGKFGPTTKISDADIDRALASFKPTGFLQLNIAEIVIPIGGAERDRGLALIRRIKNIAKTPEEFTALASEFSTGPTAGSGGNLGWRRLSELPPEAMETLQSLPAGSVSQPLINGDLARLYLVFESREQPLKGAAVVMVDFAEYLLPNTGDFDRNVADLRANSDDCDDLYTRAKGQPAEILTRRTLPQSELPRDTAAVLSLMDAGEINAQITRGSWRVVTMLCSRAPTPDMLPGREVVRTQLLNQRLGAIAEIFMEELRSEALIREY